MTLRQRTAERARRLRWPVGIGALVLLVAVLGALLLPRSNAERLDPDSVSGEGARAVAQILRANGVTVTRQTRFDPVRASARAGTTLLVTDTSLLDPTRLSALRAGGADLVLLAPDTVALGVLAPGVVAAGVVGPEVLEPLCADPAAVAAGTALAGGSLYRAPVARNCYPRDDGAASYVHVSGVSRDVVVLGQPDLLTNDRLDEDGNAALALATLGRRATLVWYLPDPVELGGDGAPPTLRELVPTGTGWVAAQLGLVVLVLLLWRGRRLGRLVTEPLPVVVRAAETQEGRARLYRRARARDRAATTLRTATLRRLARRLDVPPDAGAEQVAALAATSSGLPPAQVRDALLGAAPTDDAGLVRLADTLDALERAITPNSSQLADRKAQP